MCVCVYGWGWGVPCGPPVQRTLGALIIIIMNDHHYSIVHIYPNLPGRRIKRYFGVEHLNNPLFQFYYIYFERNYFFLLDCNRKNNIAFFYLYI